MKKYPKHKPSGVEWIGDVPEGWEVKKLKRLAKICNGQDHKDVWTEEGEYPILGTGGEFGRANKFLSVGPSVILGRKGTIDKPQFVERPFWSVDTAYFTEIYNFTDPKFFFYCCTTIQFDRYKYGSAVPSMTQETLNQIPFATPPLPEQTAIAAYLDRKTAQIDQSIAEKERLIELFREERQAIINHAVTKGIRPGAKMKPSGVEWIGDVPEGWGKVKFNHYVFLRHGYQFREFDFTPSGIKVVKITQLKPDGTLDLSETSFVSEDRLNEFSEILIREDDILMALTGGTIGKIIRVKSVDEILFQNYRVGNFFPLNQKLTKDFLFWVLSSELTLKQIFFFQRETGQPNIGKEEFRQMFFILPPINEQKEIVDFIKVKTAQIDTAISGIRQEIALLQEYRQALIFEAVTGKIDVRENAQN